MKTALNPTIRDKNIFLNFIIPLFLMTLSYGINIIILKGRKNFPKKIKFNSVLKVRYFNNKAVSIQLN
ncbi:hypothetical protein DXU93_09200 [Brumimicrobium aurantiacum]|uniref:Uncharacterized protein n=1 Tax=Brumimicrobium aurantiacum TaxID=1737063 RepID=A0A3E1EXA0_9FLAO|nr:hypothetical protein DXU93_09200 [Brumimicrobium aurantiacum]